MERDIETVSKLLLELVIEMNSSVEKYALTEEVDCDFTSNRSGCHIATFRMFAALSSGLGKFWCCSEFYLHFFLHYCPLFILYCVNVLLAFVRYDVFCAFPFALKSLNSPSSYLGGFLLSLTNLITAS